LHEDAPPRLVELLRRDGTQQRCKRNEAQGRSALA
jgi:hypothetical protein